MLCLLLQYHLLSSSDGYTTSLQIIFPLGMSASVRAAWETFAGAVAEALVAEE